ncbi:MAG: nuclear transport factor 2 family protein [Azospirillaceae bacterium]
MTQEEKAAIEAACARLVQRLAVLVDAGRYDEALALYTPDAVQVRRGQEVRGKEALARFFAARPADRLTRHLIPTTAIFVESGNRATGISYALVWRHQGDGVPAQLPLPMVAPGTLGEYHDVFVRMQEGWRLAERRTREVFDEPLPG